VTSAFLGILFIFGGNTLANLFFPIMAFKRPHNFVARRSSSSVGAESSESDVPHKLRRRSSTLQTQTFLSSYSIFIIDTKLDTHNMMRLIEMVDYGGGKLASRAEDADIIVTAIVMRKRLERHVGADISVCVILTQ
jgi:hypothetical protein